VFAVEKLRTGGKRKKLTCQRGQSEPWNAREIEMLRNIRREHPNWSRNKVTNYLKKKKGKCSFVTVNKYWNAGEDMIGLQRFRGRPRDNSLCRNDAMYALIREIVAGTPEAELAETSSFIREQTGVAISVSNLSKIYCILEITKKKATRIDWRRFTTRCMETRVLVKESLNLIPIRSIVYVDECNFNFHCIVRNSGYAPRGMTPVITQSVDETRFTLVMGMTYRRIVCYHETSYVGFSGDDYYNFCDDLLDCILESDYVFKDNVKFHRGPGIKSLFREKNRSYLFSAPYSPDLNPIENTFGWIKRRIRSFQREMGFHNYTIPELIERAIVDLNNRPHVIMGFVNGCKQEWGREDLTDLHAARSRDRVL